MSGFTNTEINTNNSALLESATLSFHNVVPKAQVEVVVQSANEIEIEEIESYIGKAMTLRMAGIGLCPGQPMVVIIPIHPRRRCFDN